MARLASTVRAGFFAVNPLVLRQLAPLLTVPPDATLLDPCCGEGAALGVLGTLWNLPEPQLYGVELEQARAAAAKALLPDAHIVGPASAFDLRCTPSTFSVAWTNPPFDDAGRDHERYEYQFAARVTELLQPGGILLLYCPANQVNNEIEGHRLTRLLTERYEDLQVLYPDAEHRPYREVLVIGRKRAKPVPAKGLLPVGTLADCVQRWTAPSTKPIRVYAKGGYIEHELVEAVCKSPLWNLTAVTKPVGLARPPMLPSRGHLALLMAAGQIDGIVRPDDEPPHVMRGTARKIQLPAEVVEEDDGRTVTTKEIIRESIELVVRTVDTTGALATYR